MRDYVLDVDGKLIGLCAPSIHHAFDNVRRKFPSAVAIRATTRRGNITWIQSGYVGAAEVDKIRKSI